MRLLLKNKSLKRKLIDINCFAINLVEDHPGYAYIEPIMTDGLMGNFQLFVLDIVPFRAHWIMTKRWDFPKTEAKEVIWNFIKGNSTIQYFGLNYLAILKAYELTKSLNHDIYDCYYVAGAISVNCHSILTTDTDFEKLCKKLHSSERIGLDYENPVPVSVLTEFAKF